MQPVQPIKARSLRTLGLSLLAAALLPALVQAQEGKASIAVSAVKPTPSLEASLKPDTKLELGRILESLNSQLMDRISATKKFDVISRSDLNDLLKEQDLGASGNVDAKTAAKAGKIAGATYVLVSTVDDFQDYTESATFEGTGRSLTKRIFRLSVVGKLYDSNTGKLIESANLQTGNDAFKSLTQNESYSTKDGALSDSMMVAAARDLAQKIAQHFADSIFPIKVLVRRDQEITINRGEGGGVAVGDVYNVFALGQELIDPDTKESLGHEEVKVGKVKITQVNSRTSQAQILEDTGINTGGILRRPPQP